MRFPSPFLLLALVFAPALLAGCASTKPYTTGPVKTFDPDNLDIPRPADARENQYWDPIDRTFFYQVEKPLNLNWTFRKLGQGLGFVGPKQAQNVNTLDEVPNSSWFTQRHFYFPMSTEELQRGPNSLPRSGGVNDGPDTERPWTVIAGKSEGKTKGFTIEDARGDRYIIKFDGPNFPELTSSAEVISTKIYYAAGYFVPQNSIAYFDPALIELADDAEVTVAGEDRLMTEDDLATILDPQPRRADGRVRAMASKYVDGLPVGVWTFRGTRDDDPNDRVRHEHRREVRGLSVLGSWLNDADRRNANTLAVYTTDVRAPGDTARYLRHYLLDMGSTLGANGSGTHVVKHGQEYLFDPRTIAAQTVTLGLRQKPYEFQPLVAFYPSIGYFTAKYFEPEDWVMVHPNPAYEYRTDRDGFWGAKRVMAFSEADIRAIVATGQLTDPDAEEYLVQTLLARQAEIGRYWFGEVNPLDRFVLARLDFAASTAPNAPTPAFTLEFDDLAVTGGLELADASRYRYAVYHGGTRLADGTADAPTVPVPALPEPARASASEDDRVLRVELVTLRDGQEPSDPTNVYLHFPLSGDARLVGIERK
ncbi:MAG: hypothetical protein ABJF88_05890 [Rhodothermales bacterium]